MKDVAIVTDSTADLPWSFIASNNIKVVPLRVIFPQGWEYKDGVDIEPQDFYKLLQRSKTLPKTSQPTLEDFLSLYSQVLKEYREIVSIHLSSKLSGTYNVAELAREKLQENIHVFDSQTVSLAMGLYILEAVEKVGQGLEGAQIIEALKKVRENTETIFSLSTLTYLYRGGRIGRAKKLMGSILNIKPILRMEEGMITAAGRVRSEQQMIKALVEKFKNLAKGRKPLRLAVAHAVNEKLGLKVKEALESSFNLKCALFGEIGATLGVHGGPGAIGAGMHFEED